jgi:hypothetical protein
VNTGFSGGPAWRDVLQERVFQHVLANGCNVGNVKAETRADQRVDPVHYLFDRPGMVAFAVVADEGCIGGARFRIG